MTDQRLDVSAIRERRANPNSGASCRIPAVQPPSELRSGSRKPDCSPDGICLDHTAGDGHSDQPIRPPTVAFPTATRRPGILVVDDDLGTLNLLEAVLWRDGFSVWSANHARQALEIYQELRSEIDLVLLDVQMPGLDGPQIWMCLKQLNPDVRFCFMTGDIGAYTVEELRECGAVYLFQKPFDLFQVVRVLWYLATSSTPKVSRDAVQQRRII